MRPNNLSPIGLRALHQTSPEQFRESVYDADCLCLSLSLYAWVCVGDKITFAENSLSQDENYAPLPNSP